MKEINNMDNKDVVINELKLCAYYYEEKLIELLGSEGFLDFSFECSKKLRTTEATDYIYGKSAVMPQ